MKVISRRLVPGATARFWLLTVIVVSFSACGRKQADDKMKLAFEKENTDWNLAALKVEGKITTHLRNAEASIEEKIKGLSEADAKAVKDSLQAPMRDWLVAAELVSDNLDAFLDENQSWLARLKSEGMEEEEAKAWWENRRSRFQELMTESQGLTDAMKGN